MDRTVGEHIKSLEERRSSLSAQLMEQGDRTKRNELETELRAVESALALFRSALELEARVVPKK
jgi:hypothetical protein